MRILFRLDITLKCFGLTQERLRQIWSIVKSEGIIGPLCRRNE